MNEGGACERETPLAASATPPRLRRALPSALAHNRFARRHVPRASRAVAIARDFSRLSWSKCWRWTTTPVAQRGRRDERRRAHACRCRGAFSRCDVCRTIGARDCASEASLSTSSVASLAIRTSPSSACTRCSHVRRGKLSRARWTRRRRSRMASLLASLDGEGDRAALHGERPNQPRARQRPRRRTGARPVGDVAGRVRLGARRRRWEVTSPRRRSRLHGRAPSTAPSAPKASARSIACSGCRQTRTRPTSRAVPAPTYSP